MRKYMYVCVYMSEREREREGTGRKKREREKTIVLCMPHLIVQNKQSIVNSVSSKKWVERGIPRNRNDR